MNPGKARAGAARASVTVRPKSAESEVLAAFIAREAIRFFADERRNRDKDGYTFRAMSESSHRALLVRALAGVPAAEPQTAARQAAIAVVLLQISDALEVLLIERAVRAGDPWS